jgi:hypothetical protein
MTTVPVLVQLPQAMIDSYLRHYSEANNTDHKWSTMTADQKQIVLDAFKENMVGEFMMRCDDHYGFETERMFEGL